MLKIDQIKMQYIYTHSLTFLNENNKFNAILKLNPQILDQMEAQRLENGH